MTKVATMRTLMGFVAMAMLLELAVAVDHTVVWGLSTNQQTWAASQTFTVGDNLVFQFDSSHDVLEVTQANYDSCSTASPISTSVTSPTTISLPASGSRYFICGRGNHCSQGMKVQIDTVAATAPGPPQTTTPSTPTPPGNSPTSGSPPPPVQTENPPAPSSAISLKMSVGSLLGFGFFVMMLLSL